MLQDKQQTPPQNDGVCQQSEGLEALLISKHKTTGLTDDLFRAFPGYAACSKWPLHELIDSDATI